LTTVTEYVTFFVSKSVEKQGDFCTAKKGVKMQLKEAVFEKYYGESYSIKCVEVDQ